MAINNKQRGFALLISIVFMTVMLSFGLALGSLGYKQTILASESLASQYAFYAADAGLECALYADQHSNLFDQSTHNASTPPNLINSVACNDVTATQYRYAWDTSLMVVAEHLDWGTRCADVTIYKYSTPQGVNNVTTYIYAQGYNASCAVVSNPQGARFVSRGLSAHY